MSALMSQEPQIEIHSKFLSLNGTQWTEPPLIGDFLKALGCHDFQLEGGVTIDGKIVLQFLIFNDYGLEIGKRVRDDRVSRLKLFLVGKTKRQSASMKPFRGQLLINGKIIPQPCNEKLLPVIGDLPFINHIAVGENLSVSLAKKFEFIETITTEFRQTGDRKN